LYKLLTSEKCSITLKLGITLLPKVQNVNEGGKR
jgi:hypothetical protein